MKTTLSVIFALAASTMAAPVVKRDQSTNDVDSTVDAVNYILTLEGLTAGKTAYDEEIKAVTNPAAVLGKRNQRKRDQRKRDQNTNDVDSTVDAVNYILTLEGLTAGKTAYDEEIKSVTNPAAVLGKRDQNTNDVDSTVDAVNYILTLEGLTAGKTAYDEEIKSVTNPAAVLGKRDQNTNDVDSTVDAVNYILTLEGLTAGKTAYDEEIKSVANPADVLG